MTRDIEIARKVNIIPLLQTKKRGGSPPPAAGRRRFK